MAPPTGLRHASFNGGCRLGCLGKVRLEQIIEAKLPDLRLIANNIEFECG